MAGALLKNIWRKEKKTLKVIINNTPVSVIALCKVYGKIVPVVELRQISDEEWKKRAKRKDVLNFGE